MSWAKLFDLEDDIQVLYQTELSEQEEPLVTVKTVIDDLAIKTSLGYGTVEERDEYFKTLSAADARRYIDFIRDQFNS